MRLYIIFGVIICALFFTAGTRGMAMFAMSKFGRPGPAVHGLAHK